MRHIDAKNASVNDKSIVLTAARRHRIRSLHLGDKNMFSTSNNVLGTKIDQDTKSRMFWGLVSKWEQSLRQELIESVKAGEL